MAKGPNEVLNNAWDAAFDPANNGVSIPIGDNVVCDDCNVDYTGRPDQGGIVFGSRGICPACTPQWLESAKKYDEEKFIVARCPPGQSYWRFICDFRGPDSAITVTRGGRGGIRD